MQASPVVIVRTPGVDFLHEYSLAMQSNGDDTDDNDDNSSQTYPGTLWIFLLMDSRIQRKLATCALLLNDDLYSPVLVEHPLGCFYRKCANGLFYLQRA